MDALQEELLTNLGDCPLHYHSHDRVPTHDTLAGLQQMAKQVSPTGTTYTVTDKDDHILCRQTMTVQLPRAVGGKEYEVTMMFTPGTVTVTPTGSDTVMGTTSCYTTIQWTSLRFKAIFGGWILI